MSADAALRFPRLREVWAKEEAALDEARLAAEQAARTALAANDPDAAADSLSRFMQSSVERALERAHVLADEFDAAR